MQTPKARKGSSEVPQRVSSRAVRQLKPTALETEAVSGLNPAIRTSKDKSPKVVKRRSPRSPVLERKRPSRISELEAQVSQLQEELKKANEQLCSSEACKDQAQKDAEESKEQLLSMSVKLEESQKQVVVLSALEETLVLEHQKISQEQDQAWQSDVEAIQKQHSLDSTAMVSAVNEIQRLKVQLEKVVESEAALSKEAESAHLELQSLKGTLEETVSVVSNMKNQLKDSQRSESEAQALASETLLQLEAAKKTVEELRTEGMKAVEAYNSITSELEQSRKHVYSLEELVNKLKVDLMNASGNISPEFDSNSIVVEHQGKESDNPEESQQLGAEISSLKSEMVWLRSALEAAEVKCHEEQIQSTVKIESAHELVEQIKSEASSREAEILAELEKAKLDIAYLKANLMDKETDLQEISEENEELHMKLEKNLSCNQELELKNELKVLKETIVEFDSNFIVVEHQGKESDNPEQPHQLGAEVSSLKSKMVRLRSALEAAEVKCHEEQIQSTVKIECAHELVEQIKSEASSREAEILAELEKAKLDIADLNANLMDKETDLQEISEENEELHMKLEKNLSCNRELELKNELKVLKEAVVELNSNSIVIEHQGKESDNPEQTHQLGAEVSSLKSKMVRLRSALEAAEVKCHEEQIQSTVKIESAYELVEQTKSKASSREAEILAELEKAKLDIADLKANLMDKETELQGISEENEELHMKLEKNLSCNRELELKNELKVLKEAIVDLKANMMDKETELQNISEENEMLRLEISKTQTDKGKTYDKVASELEKARAAEREAIMKLRFAMEEADKNNRRAARVNEQLESAQIANSEIEAELRKLKVQSDQWRKAAEAAAAMISPGNNGKLVERTGSLDSNYNPVTAKLTSPYPEDDDLLKKKNGNMLKKIGVLWKKPQK